MVGFAATASFRATMPPPKGEGYASVFDQIERFAELGGPPVLVFQDMDDPIVGATFGEVMCTTYQAFGARGLITSGTGRDLDQVRASHKVDAERVELHTGRYCEARNARERQRELERLVDAAKAATKLGMGCAAGHGLNYENVRPVARIAEIDELNIGHAIVARAVLVGLDRAVRDMLALMRRD